MDILLGFIIIFVAGFLWLVMYVHFGENNVLDTRLPGLLDMQTPLVEHQENVMDQKLNLIKLKIKAKSLAEEARIIRKEERTLSGWQRGSLHDHRVGIVRDEARATYLTAAFMLGKPYKLLEATCHEPSYRDLYVLPKVVRMLQKYHDVNLKMESVQAWVKADYPILKRIKEVMEVRYG